jgi:hypothetical protein
MAARLFGPGVCALVMVVQLVGISVRRSSDMVVLKLHQTAIGTPFSFSPVDRFDDD